MLIVIIIYGFYSFVPYIEVKSEASTALDNYAPVVDIGSPIPEGFYPIDLTGFLSHVLDSAKDAVKKNLGYIWNRVVDSGYCPGNIQNHRHNFIYGLTSKNITDPNINSPKEGYYCYCEYCGQLAGDLIQDYINENNIQDDGSFIVYPSYSWLGASNSQTFIEDDIKMTVPWGNKNYYESAAYGSGSLEFKGDRVEYHFDIKRGYMKYGSVYDVLGIQNVNAIYYETPGRTSHNFASNDSTYYPELRIDVTNSIIRNPNRYIRMIQAEGRSINYEIIYDNGDALKTSWLNIFVDEEELQDVYNKENIYAPVSYVNNGVLIYGGYSNKIVDLNSNRLFIPQTEEYYEIIDYEYDYSSDTWSLDVDGFDVPVTVRYTDDGVVISDGTNEYILLYTTNTLTPVNPIVGPSNSNGSIISGVVNLTVNQVSSSTNAYITTNEDVPQGLRGLRETLATMFVEIPEMTGEFTDFMQTGFSYIPDEVMTLVIFGVSVAVFVGIFKLFWR